MSRELTLGSAPGPVLTLLTLGATVHRLEITGGDGVRRNVTLGQPTDEDRLASSDYLGGTIGRYANRIAQGRFELDGVEVQVAAHDRGNSLHGGPDGFDRREWTVLEEGPDEALLELVSPDGDQGFPGTLRAQVRVRVEADAVRMTFEATTDATTVCNLTNHAYFNLDGEGAGTVDEHLLTVHAAQYTPIDDTGIPLGEHAPVSGTPFDLRTPTRIGTAVRGGHEQQVAAQGIDHNYVLEDAAGGLREVAVLESPRTRTRVHLHSDQPGLQVYTGNFLDGTSVATGGGRYRQGDGVALEPQLFPDSPHHTDQPQWPSAVLRPGETYRAELAWVFSRTA